MAVIGSGIQINNRVIKPMTKKPAAQAPAQPAPAETGGGGQRN
jgi:hypothetical protein